MVKYRKSGAADFSGARSRVTAAFDNASKVEFTDFVHDQAQILMWSAEAKGHDFLTYLLEMVAVEAARLRDEK